MCRPAPERVRQLLEYNPLSGRMTWRERVAQRSPVGSEAGFLSDGRWRITIAGKRYFRSVLAWVIVRGEWPTFEVDHENRDSLDDRWSNLRPATRSQNLANRGLLRSNSSGTQGVLWVESSSKWQAQIQKDGKTIYIGRYTSKDDAADAYAKKARELFGEYAQSCVEQSAWVRSGSSPADEETDPVLRSGSVAAGRPLPQRTTSALPADRRAGGSCTAPSCSVGEPADA